MRVQRDLRRKVLPGPPEGIQALRGWEGQGSEGWVPEPRAVPHASEAKVCIMRVQGERVRAALQHHRLVPPAPRQHDAGEEAARGGAEASGRGFSRTAVAGFGAAPFRAAGSGDGAAGGVAEASGLAQPETCLG